MLSSFHCLHMSCLVQAPSCGEIKTLLWLDSRDDLNTGAPPCSEHHEEREPGPKAAAWAWTDNKFNYKELSCGGSMELRLWSPRRERCKGLALLIPQGNAKAEAGCLLSGCRAVSAALRLGVLFRKFTWCPLVLHWAPLLVPQNTSQGSGN